jgi:MFS family permease
VGAYAKLVPLLVFSSIFNGFSGYSLIIICYIIAGDVCEEHLRQRGTLYMNFSYSLGLTSFFLVYNWLNEWYNILVLVMLIPFIGITITCGVLLVESPNYYLCKLGSKKKCIDSLTTIAFYNNR